MPSALCNERIVAGLLTRSSTYEPAEFYAKGPGNWAILNKPPAVSTDEGNVCFTRSKDGHFVNAICKEWPRKNFTSKLLKPKQYSKITMLGTTTSLTWKYENSGLTINIPDKFHNIKKPS